MAIALVQNSAAWSLGSATNTLPSNSTAGNLLVAYIAYAGGGSATGAPASWVQATNDNTLGRQIWYYANNPGSLNSFTFTNATELLIAEFSGVATATPIDTVANGAQSASSPFTITTAGNATSATDLAVGSFNVSLTKSGTDTLTAGTGWTNLKDNSATSLSDHSMATYRIGVTSGTTVSESITSASMNLSVLAGVLAVFKPAGAGSSTSPSSSLSPSASISPSSSVSASTSPSSSISASVSPSSSISPSPVPPIGRFVTDAENSFGVQSNQTINRMSTF